MPPPPATSRVTLAIKGMHCAFCVATIEEALSGVTGVTGASVNLATGRAQVVGRGLYSPRLIEAVRRSGYYAKPAREEEPWQADDRAARELRQNLRRTLIAAALTVPVLVVSIADIRFRNRNFALLLLTLPVYLYAGWPFLAGMVRAFQQRTANMDSFVGLVATAALLLSVGSTFFPRVFTSAGAAHAYYAVVGFVMTLRLSASFWIGGFEASLPRRRRCLDCIFRGR